MAYDEDLDAMVRAAVEKDGMIRKKMFGGTCYLLDGRMVCGVWKDNVILKLGETESGKALAAGLGKVFDITGKPMKAWIMVEGNGLTIESVVRWVEAAKRFAASP